MCSSIVIFVIVAAISLWVVVATVRCFVCIVRGGYASRFFSRPRGWLSCHGFGHKGISLLCRDTGDIARLRNLLAVEYPDYEVVVVADSLRNADSLQQIVTKYRMVVVDGRMSGDERVIRVRRMYRSASRCYRRLLLLDVATTDSSEDLDVAFDVATYDYLLPLWGDERLCRGAIERLIAEVCTLAPKGWRTIGTRVGPPLRLISRHTADEAGGVAAAVNDERECHYMYESLLFDPRSAACRRPVAGVVILVLMLLSIGAAVAGIAPLLMSAIVLTLTVVVVATYAAGVVSSHGDKPAVGYGENLSLFCENLLPWIWQIRK